MLLVTQMKWGKIFCAQVGKIFYYSYFILTLKHCIKFIIAKETGRIWQMNHFSFSIGVTH
jgi:hypothetical protein